MARELRQPWASGSIDGRVGSEADGNGADGGAGADGSQEVMVRPLRRPTTIGYD